MPAGIDAWALLTCLLSVSPSVCFPPPVLCPCQASRQLPFLPLRWPVHLGHAFQFLSYRSSDPQQALAALLLPQTDPILSSLSRAPKAPHPSDTTGQNRKGSSALLQTSGTQLDVRAFALVAFRDRIVLPLYPHLYAYLTNYKDAAPPELEPHQARLQQMFVTFPLCFPLSYLVTHPQAPRPCFPASAAHGALPHAPPTGALARGDSYDAPPPCAPHAPRSATPRTPAAGADAPSFLSRGLPRDRRGRIAQKPKSSGSVHSYYYSGWGGGVNVGGGYGNGGYANGRAVEEDWLGTWTGDAEACVAGSVIW